ncbi:MAG: 50S ribosomal protein L22, partial [Candidatus Promineifilaceae bacterium]|nr:50S ribosomal protein L22 [Candidatus Promineifilaceae bacterium]
MAEVFEVKAVARHIPISVQKVRLVIDVIRGKDADEALDLLRFMPQKAAEPVYKVVQSAVANAEQNYGLDIEEL